MDVCWLKIRPKLHCFPFFVIVVLYIITTLIFQCRKQFCDGKSHGYVVRRFNFFYALELFTDKTFNLSETQFLTYKMRIYSV